MIRRKAGTAAVALIVVTLFASEVLARVRCFSPEQGQFTQRDPAAYVDGMSLYEYLAGNPTVSQDPAGTQVKVPRPKWKEGCCCCVEDLRIEDVKELSPQEGHERFLCHQFTLRAWLKYKNWGKTFKDCEIQWWEWPLTPADPTERHPKPAPKKTWTNLVDYVPDHDMWKGFYDQNWRVHLGSSMELAVIFDEPGVKPFVPELKRSHEQRLYFAIRVLSAKGCTCDYKWRSAYAYQEYLVQKGVVKRMEFAERKVVPNNFLTQPDKPGLPPGWALTGGR